MSGPELEALGLFGVVVLLCQTIVEIVKAFAFKKKYNGQNSLTKREHEALMRLDEAERNFPTKELVNQNGKILSTLQIMNATLSRIEQKKTSSRIPKPPGS